MINFKEIRIPGVVWLALFAIGDLMVSQYVEDQVVAAIVTILIGAAIKALNLSESEYVTLTKLLRTIHVKPPVEPTEPPSMEGMRSAEPFPKTFGVAEYTMPVQDAVRLEAIQVKAEQLDPPNKLMRWLLD